MQFPELLSFIMGLIKINYFVQDSMLKPQYRISHEKNKHRFRRYIIFQGTFSVLQNGAELLLIVRYFINQVIICGDYWWSLNLVLLVYYGWFSQW